MVAFCQDSDPRSRPAGAVPTSYVQVFPPVTDARVRIVTDHDTTAETEENRQCLPVGRSQRSTGDGPEFRSAVGHQQLMCLAFIPDGFFDNPIGAMTASASGAPDDYKKLRKNDSVKASWLPERIRGFTRPQDSIQRRIYLLSELGYVDGDLDVIRQPRARLANV